MRRTGNGLTNPEGCVDQGDFVRRGTLDVNRDGESAAIGDRHDLRALPALRLAHAGASLLRWCEAPIDEGFLQIQIAFVVEGLGEDLENAAQHTRAHPLLKPPVARLIGGIPVREIGPWGAVIRARMVRSRSGSWRRPQNRSPDRRFSGAEGARIGTTITCSGPLFHSFRTHLDVLGESAYPHLACLVVPIPAVLSSCRVRSIC